MPGQAALDGPVPAQPALNPVLATSGEALATRAAVAGPPPLVDGLAPALPDSAGRRVAADPGGPARSPEASVPDRPDGPARVAELARAAVRLADRTGAPLAELLERIEADARAADRGLAAAAAQAAGARATAWLLAALPLGGIGLGYAIGVDPVAVLLHTPVGGASAVAAVGLQVGGLLWAERLGAAPGRVG
ncbi:hypothetical protein DKT69_12325 [Micromonospora sicca]|uniref:Tight adherence protein B n=1 Tax=Micromonospora sicca TaxID=2202420 RepID=A0A317DQF0_9ACTN|nr:hypothetical protein DKT69_12325 [Micromonospora sp. 4G51]